MNSCVATAIELVNAGCPAFFKFIVANETGINGSHQRGYYIPKSFAELSFGDSLDRGDNPDVLVKIDWNDSISTTSRLVYYGKAKNEARVTRFGRGFEFLKSDYTGALIVFVMEKERHFRAFIFKSEEEIDEFLGALGLGPADANKLIRRSGEEHDAKEDLAFAGFIKTLTVDFPSSDSMSEAARTIEDSIYNHAEYIRTNPDVKLLKWAGIEYRLFRAIENDRYGSFVSKGFACVDDFIEKANMVLNRRKSRAGKSLEHHLSAIFSGNALQFEEQVVTEGNKKPDFLFPSASAYHDTSYPIDKLVFLAAKTTCKDRWRQILNEADRFRKRTKFLCTLQQGMTVKQMKEMSAEMVVLVVPKPYIATYPRGTSLRIITLVDFINTIKRKQVN